MRYLILLSLLFIAAPAFALSNSLAEFCLTSSDVRDCIQRGITQEREAERRHERAMAELQREIAEKQALGLALFGSGPAIIGGMNQGFQNMQVKPYMLPTR